MIDLWLVIGAGGNWTWAEEDKQERIRLEGFSDADGASQHHHHSISRYVFTIDGGTMSWSSKKQSLVVLSTTEAEYIAATHAAKEAMWIWTLLAEVAQLLTWPTTLYCDNQSAISILKNDQYHTYMKHINIHYHFMRDIAEQGILSICYCPTLDMLMKALPSPQLLHL